MVVFPAAFAVLIALLSPLASAIPAVRAAVTDAIAMFLRDSFEVVSLTEVLATSSMLPKLSALSEALVALTAKGLLKKSCVPPISQISLKTKPID